eukprot:415932_1
MRAALLLLVIAQFRHTRSGVFGGKKPNFIPPSVEWNIAGDPHQKDNGLGIFVEENPPKPRYELIFGDDVYLQKESKVGYFLDAWIKYEYIGSFREADTTNHDDDNDAVDDDDPNEEELKIVLKYGRKYFSLPATVLESKLNDGSAQIKISIAKKFTKANHPKKPLPEWITRIGDGKKMDHPPYFQGKWRGKIKKNEFNGGLDGPLSALETLKPLDAARKKAFSKYTARLFKKRKATMVSKQAEGLILYKYSALNAQHSNILDDEVYDEHDDEVYDEHDDEEEENQLMLGPLSVMMTGFVVVLCCIMSLILGGIAGFFAAIGVYQFRGKSNEQEVYMAEQVDSDHGI